MRRGYRVLTVLLCCLSLLTVPAWAAQSQEEDVLERQAQALELDELDEAAGDYAPPGGVTGTDLEEGLSQIWESGSRELPDAVGKGLRSGGLLLAVVLLCALACGTLETAGGEGALDVATVTGTLAISAISVGDVGVLVGMGREALDYMSTFSNILLPTMAAATAAAGSPGGAAARQMATMLFSGVLVNLIDKLLLPLTYGYIALCVAHAAVGNEGLKRVAGVVKGAVTGMLTIVMLLLVVYHADRGVVAGTADAMAVKAAKFTVSSMVPVVGGILSDAAETVLVGAGVLKNAVGVFGMLVVLSICLAPFLQLGAHYLTYKIAGALSATVADSRLAGLIDGIGGAFGLVLGMTGASALLLLVSMVSAVSMAAP